MAVPLQQNETAAHVAAGAGQMEALSFLTVKGAQLSMEDERGSTEFFLLLSEK